MAHYVLHFKAKFASFVATFTGSLRDTFVEIRISYTSAAIMQNCCSADHAVNHQRNTVIFEHRLSTKRIYIVQSIDISLGIAHYVANICSILRFAPPKLSSQIIRDVSLTSAFLFFCTGPPGQLTFTHFTRNGSKKENWRKMEPSGVYFLKFNNWKSFSKKYRGSFSFESKLLINGK